MIIVTTVLLGMHWYVLAKFKPYMQGAFLPSLIALTLLFPVSSIIERAFYHWSTRALYYIGSLELGIMFLLFSAFVIVDILTWIFQLSLPSWYVLAILGFVIVVALFGMVQASKITIVEKTIPFPEDITILHLTDIHLGAINGKAFLEKVVQQSNNVDYDLVLMTGDLYDGSGVVNKDTLEPLQKLTKPVYFVLGNHEQYIATQEVLDVLKELNITVLRDEVVDWQNIQIAGYDHRENDKELPTLQITKPAIILFHPPDGIEKLSNMQTPAIQFSGHTHGGQIFPFNLLVRLKYRYVTELHNIGNNWLFIANGAGTWGPPLRIGAPPQIGLLHLQKDI